MEPLKLYMLLLGADLPGRHIEQHDMFFGIAPSLKELIPDIKAHWPEAGEKLHIDGWREVNFVEGYQVEVVAKGAAGNNPLGLFFLNLGGYKPNEMEEYHYKMISVSKDMGEAIRAAKETTFYKHTGFGNLATSHVDNKYGVDVDNIYEVKEILPAHMREKYQLKITPVTETKDDEIHLGYFQLHKI
ncbi:DUF1543 domain-containing protein [Chitinophaga sp. Mgbs1]|uniref:DUF1543 domain-containing protein n=1 Tax=Chitinophaga solisilvae TaxID=1233460 RepID=A0A3S1JFB7_9BACT|nr:DUF1543 domain-containing protein [Chitinophaga solisilvae]